MPLSDNFHLITYEIFKVSRRKVCEAYPKTGFSIKIISIVCINSRFSDFRGEEKDTISIYKLANLTRIGTIVKKYNKKAARRNFFTLLPLPLLVMLLISFL